MRVAFSIASLLLAFTPSLSRADAPTTNAPSTTTPSFANEIVPIFTRFGCNQGACHGKGEGQNGFRLSLRGYAPEMDHTSITREFLNRRISFTDPQASPLLRKATGQATHEGGKLLSRGDKAYNLLLTWIEAGAPGPKKEDPTLASLQLSQTKLTLKPGDSHQLKLEANFSDGRKVDVTWLAKFESNDPGTAEVDAHGKITVRRHGETAIRAMFQTEVAVTLVTAAFERPIDPARFAVKNNFIDEHVFAKLSALRIEPSDLCSDNEFLRRAYLDTLGILPTPAEVLEWQRDTAKDKRAKWIEKLLARPEFVDHWTLFLSDLMQNRKERDHDVRGTKGVRSFHAWIRKQVEAEKGWDEIAKAVLLAKGTTDESPAVGYYIVTVGEHNDPARSEVVDSVAQAFMGTRIGCARCHNHPLERFTQDDFYHFAGFFSRVKLERKDPKQGPTKLRMAGTEGKEPHLAKDKIGVRQPRTNAFLEPRPLDRSITPTTKPGDDPRVPFVTWLTDPKNESFSGAMVNRLWRHYFGVGLVEPVDDLRASNPPTNPELWNALNAEFVKNKFSMKHMMRLILNSRTYQLSAGTKPTNATDTRFFSHYNARRLPAEVLLDAIATSTGVADRFEGYPEGMRAGQLPDPTLKSYFLSLFGRSERVTACACERSGEVTMPQLLHLQNSEEILRKMRNGSGRLMTLLKDTKGDDAVIDELFLATLSRLPSEKQRERVKTTLANSDKKKETREEIFRDLFWALLNSKEFAFNH
jgi:hypothetical protein